MSIPASTFPTSAADGPQNTNTVSVASNYEICDRTGFRVPVGELAKEWTGAMVRRESWEARHPLDFVRGRAEHAKGSPRPEQVDTFIVDGEQIEVGDL